MNIVLYIFLGLMFLQGILYFVVKYKFHWIYIFKGKDEMSRSKVICKFTNKNANVNDVIDEYTKLKKKQENRKKKKLRIEKLNRLKKL